MKTNLLLFLIISFQISYGQDIKIKLISKTLLEADQFIGTDELENIYFIKGNTLFKKSENEILAYANVALGTIESVDIHNPFKIIIFYKDFNSIVLLDNKLNELSDRIDFTKEVLFNNVLSVSQSSENNLWLFADDSKLHLYDFQNRFEKLQTQQVTFYESKFIGYTILSTYKNVYIIGNLGVIQFNQFGNFIKFHNLVGFSHLSLFMDGFIYVKDSTLFYHINEKIVPFELNFKGEMKDIYINNTSITIFDGSAIFIYQFM